MLPKVYILPVKHDAQLNADISYACQDWYCVRRTDTNELLALCYYEVALTLQKAIQFE